jgi:hypothetical protein
VKCGYLVSSVVGSVNNLCEASSVLMANLDSFFFQESYKSICFRGKSILIVHNHVNIRNSQITLVIMCFTIARIAGFESV